MYDRTESFDSSARIEENVSKFLTYDEQTKFREIKDLNGILQKKSPKLKKILELLGVLRD